MPQTYVKKRHPEFYIFSANIGSTEGLSNEKMVVQFIVLSDHGFARIIHGRDGKVYLDGQYDRAY